MKVEINTDVDSNRHGIIQIYDREAMRRVAVIKASIEEWGMLMCGCMMQAEMKIDTTDD